ncbi:hypothetical protein B0A52_01472 [Exophiala mesophila]|uniref:Protein kinase domain-containing protein n=1 Tax=Exophiala mesophila TaxID=212818 RepID=A0A438NF31_EXOME|nr:hypothetical protein B0A52_01472 [Exophiala mesophila]
MAESQEADAPTCHILDFWYDDQDGCALTALVNGVRFHVIVDGEEFKKSGNQELSQSYQDLIHAVKRQNAGDVESSAAAEGREEGLHGGEVKSTSQMTSRSASSERKSDKDSAIDMTDDRRRLRSSDKQNDPAKDEDAERTLQNWILSAFADQTQRLAPKPQDKCRQSLQEWYHGSTHYFELKVKQGSFAPQELEETSELEDRINALIPRMPTPKFIREMNVPWIKATEIEVLSEVDTPEPVHPGEVKVKDEVHFFKPVDGTQPQAMKRELKLLKEIERIGLHDQIRVPKLVGLVRFEDSKVDIMGFLLTRIEGARPLTTLLNSEVAEERRLKWADESKDVVQTLHKHKIIWGDAKADNFMVDEEDNLWIIDFGGSYTEGWIDAELSETKKGDEMGLDKIVNALVDPDENTFDPGEDEGGKPEGGGDGDGDGDGDEDEEYIPAGEKRKSRSDENEDGKNASKRRK